MGSMVFHLFFEMFKRIRCRLLGRRNVSIVCRPVGRACLTFISAGCTRVKPFLRRCPRTSTTSKWRSIRVMCIARRGRWRRRRGWWWMRMRMCVLCTWVFSPGLLHLLPCGENIPSISICRPRMGLLCRRGRSEVLACKSVSTIAIGSILLWRGRSLRSGLWRRGAVVGTTGGCRGVGRPLGLRRWASSRSVGIRARRWNVDASIFPPFCIVFCSLSGVAQYLVGSLDVLKLLYELRLVSWITIRMEFECELSKRFADL